MLIISKWRLVLIGAAIALAGIGVVSKGSKESRLSEVAMADPQVITCKKLAEDGPKDNAHIILTDFICSPYYVYEGKKSSDSSNSAWTKVWIPLIPADDPWSKGYKAALLLGGAALDNYPPPDSFSVLLRSSNIKSEKSLGQFVDKKEIQGIIVNEIEMIYGEEKKLLTENYNFDPSKAWILDEGRTLSNSIIFFASGVLLIIVGIGAVAYAFVRKV